MTFRARDKTFNYDFNMMGTFESQDTNSIWSWGDAMTNIFVVGALRESHLGALHKGATYQGSGMPDTRRDLFSLSTTIGPPRAATVRENINSIRASCWWLRILRLRFHVPVSTFPPICIIFICYFLPFRSFDLFHFVLCDVSRLRSL